MEEPCLSQIKSNVSLRSEKEQVKQECTEQNSHLWGIGAPALVTKCEAAQALPFAQLLVLVLVALVSLSDAWSLLLMLR